MLIVFEPDDIEKTGPLQVPALRAAFQLFIAVLTEAAGTLILLIRTVEFGGQLKVMVSWDGTLHA